MSEEKLRALLAEAREWVRTFGEAGCPEDQCEECAAADEMVQRIDAALAPKPKNPAPDTMIQWVTIPAGSITTLDGRVLTVKRPFQLAATPTTQAQYAAAPMKRKKPSQFQGADLPVESMTLPEAESFAKKIGARLPTSIEWEYAALAGSPADPYGPLEDIAWFGANSGLCTRPVGTKDPNAWGLYDMLGNVWEWAAMPDGVAYRVHGGAYDSTAAHLRASICPLARHWWQEACVGFRCARDLKEVSDAE